jgi:uncharacterized membrane protein
VCVITDVGVTLRHRAFTLGPEVAVESKVKFAGHPLHTMMIVFPLGLLGAAAIFDVIYLVSYKTGWTEAAFYMIIAGCVGGLLAAVPGALDWWTIPRGTRAKRIGLWHGVGNVVVVGLFFASWLLRYPDPATPPLRALGLGFVGLLIALVTGWLGGELVDRLGVGVDDGAHLDAPNSLTGHPAQGR